MKFTIRNRYDTLIYAGQHDTEKQAWEAMFIKQKYPVVWRSIEVEKRNGLYITEDK